METNDEKGFAATIRVRVPESLKTRLARIAAAKVKTLPEACRESFVKYAESEEAKTAEHPKTEAA